MLIYYRRDLIYYNFGDNVIIKKTIILGKAIICKFLEGGSIKRNLDGVCSLH